MINERPSLLDQDTQWTALPNRPLDEFSIFQSMMRAQKNGSSEEDLLQCLVIMARLHLVRFRKNILDAAQINRQSKNAFFNTDEGHYYEDWRRFRRRLESFQTSVRAFSRFTARHFREPKSFKSLREIRSDEEDAIMEARALECEIRDILQINTSRLALIESRNTIEEGKRVKLSRSPHLIDELPGSVLGWTQSVNR